MALLMSGTAVYAQVPRIRTSAPKEKTAVLKGDKTAAEVPEKAPAKTETKPEKKASPGGPRFMAVKTNLAYDAVAILNAGFEIEVTPHFSVDIPVIWSLWDWKQDFGLRMVAVQPEARYWLKKAGSGSAFGINFGIASYNFRHDDIRYQNAGRPLLSVALAYTYALHIADRWDAEFSLAVGYANARYNRYYNIDNGALINTKNRNYFGPTKIGISLSYRLGK